MKENTITFTDGSTLRKGFFLIKEGIRLVISIILRKIDASIHAYPYLFIGLVVILQSLLCLGTIIELRQQRDAAWHEQYLLKQENERIKIMKGVNNE